MRTALHMNSMLIIYMSLKEGWDIFANSQADIEINLLSTVNLSPQY